ncbi:MAG: CHRD domain-containing protein, partial [Acidimicrobiia bacterium]
MMRRLLLLAVVAVLGALGIGGASAGTGDSASVLIADLSGDHQIPTAVPSAGSGFVSLAVSGDETTIDYRLYAHDLVGVTQAHIHIGAADANGPVAAFLFGFADPAVDSDGLLSEGTLMEADLTGAVASMTDLVSKLRSGDAYVNIHTVANPPGELRGQIRAAPLQLSASLSGDDQVPPLMSAGSGFTSFAVSADETSVGFRIYAQDVVGVTQAHVHIGESDANGPVAAFLFGFDAGGVDPDGLLAEGTLTAADL